MNTKIKIKKSYICNCWITPDPSASRANQTRFRKTKTNKKIESEILLLQNQANKESQLNTQVKINTEVQLRRSEIIKFKNELHIQ